MCSSLLGAELLLRKPWMPGMTDIEQLSLIFQNLGTPTDAVWPGARGLPNYVEFQATTPPPLKAIFPKVTPNMSSNKLWRQLLLKAMIGQSLWLPCRSKTPSVRWVPLVFTDHATYAQSCSQRCSHPFRLCIEWVPR